MGDYFIIKKNFLVCLQTNDLRAYVNLLPNNKSDLSFGSLEPTRVVPNQVNVVGFMDEVFDSRLLVPPLQLKIYGYLQIAFSVFIV